MADANPLLADFKRYADLITLAVADPFSFDATAENDRTLQVERGIVYPQVLRDPKAAELLPAERVIEMAGSDRLASIAVVDGADHHRPVYTGLLIYSLLQTYAIAYETLSASAFGRWEEGLRPWCDMLESELASI